MQSKLKKLGGGRRGGGGGGGSDVVQIVAHSMQVLDQILAGP